MSKKQYSSLGRGSKQERPIRRRVSCQRSVAPAQEETESAVGEDSRRYSASLSVAMLNDSSQLSAIRVTRQPHPLFSKIRPLLSHSSALWSIGSPYRRRRQQTAPAGRPQLPSIPLLPMLTWFALLVDSSAPARTVTTTSSSFSRVFSGSDGCRSPCCLHPVPP